MINRSVFRFNLFNDGFSGFQYGGLMIFTIDSAVLRMALSMELKDLIDSPISFQGADLSVPASTPCPQARPVSDLKKSLP